MELRGITASDLSSARSGDEAAFARVFRGLQPAVLRYLRTLAGDAADDLAAETWVHVVRGLRGFSGDVDGFRGWVFTVARHRYVDHVRLVGRRPPVLDESHALDLPAAYRVEDAVEEVMSTETALRLIGRLPPDQAEVVLLRVVAGLDVRHTAEVLGRRPGTVRVLAHRGLRRLARLLAEAGVDAAARELPGELPGEQPTGRSRGVTRSDASSVTGES